MARRINHIILIATLLASACVIEGASITDWVNGLVKNINQQVEQEVSDWNEQVSDLNKQLSHLGEDIQKRVEETIQSLPKDAQGNTISTGSSSIISIGNGTRIVTIVRGSSRTVVTGYTPNGEPFVCDVTEKQIGDMLYYNKTIFYPKTNTSDTTAWKLDLAIPNSKPQIITDTKTDTNADNNLC